MFTKQTKIFKLHKLWASFAFATFMLQRKQPKNVQHMRTISKMAILVDLKNVFLK